MGWAYCSGSREKLTVQALLNNAIVGESIADIHRPDLAAVGMGDGSCGYHITFYQAVDPLYLPFVVVKLEGGDVDMPRSTLSGYSDFFAALYKKHPVTGRHRSVFGGLWTDRIDAVAMLKDRTEIGMVPAGIAPLIAGFLQTGLTTIETGSPQGVTSGGTVKSPVATKRGGSMTGASPRGKTPDLAEAVCNALQSKPVLDVLQAILESAPLALNTAIVEGMEENYRQISAMEVLRSPAECLALIVPLDDKAVELDVIRDSHLFPEFSAEGQSRWIDPSSGAAIEVALREHGMVDHYTVQPGSVAIAGPGLIHRVRTEPGAIALRVHCTPSRIAPLDRMLDGSRKEIALESGARVWM